MTNVQVGYQGVMNDDPYSLCGYGVEEAVSRILYQQRLSPMLAAIIYPGRQLPDASSNQPEG